MTITARHEKRQFDKDLEDAVKFSERQNIIKNLCDEAVKYKDFYIRVPLYAKEKVIDISFLQLLIKAGFKKFIFPKLESAEDYEIIITNLKQKDLQIILLVETTRFFLELKNLLLKDSTSITAIALGSHDFMNEVGGIHSLKNLEYPRLQLLYLARMGQVEAIDIASMELQSKEKLTQEILDGFEKGYDAKFYIHPWQISIKESISLYTQNDLTWAKKVIKILREVNNSDEFNPVVIEGQIIERPHLNKAKKILQYYESK